MITQDQIGSISDATAYDSEGAKVGSVGNVYLSDDSGTPAWATVNTGLFGTGESFVPLAEATLDGDRLTLPYAKAKIKDAPRVGDDGHIEPSEEEELYRYYGLSAGTEVRDETADQTTTDRTVDTDAMATPPVPTGTPADGTTVGHDTSGPTTDDAMTRSEEHLEVGTERREAGRARLRKYVTTETQTVTVPVRHEEVRLEREPITDANAGDALDGPAISEEEHEVILTEERPVVTTEAVPVERVRLGTTEVEETETVSGEVRKEQIDLDAGTEARTEK